MIVHPDYLGFKRCKKRVWHKPHPLFLMENEIEQDKDVKDEYSEVICYLLPLVFEILRKLS